MRFNWTARRMGCIAMTMAWVGAWGCTRGISFEEYDAISAWLTCDDCIEGERERVFAIGKRAIPFLDEALDSLPGNRRENMRAQYWELHQFIESAEDSTTFVNGYLESMETVTRLRSIASLGDLGAEKVLQEALNDPPVGSSPEVITALETALVRADLPPVGTGPADTWAVVAPAVGVNLCSGFGTTPCEPPDVPRIDLVAEASGPSGTFLNPWPVGTVYFFFRPLGSGDPPREAGRVSLSEGVSSDNGVTRFYRWTLSLSAYRVSSGPIRVFAVVAPTGDEPIRSTRNDSITVVEGY